MNKLLKNKFLRENLILAIVLALIFPPYAFSDVWVADTGDEQVSRLYKEGHVKTVIKVTEVGEGGDTIAVNINPTALFYPGLKLSFGANRADVYEIDRVDSDPNVGWTITFINPVPDDIADTIYMELVRAGGFAEPVSVSVNQSNNRVWIADDSEQDSGVTQISGWGRDELSDTTTVTPYYIGDPGNEFEEGDTMFKLYSEDTGILPGMKIDFKSDNRAQTDTYVLEIKNITGSYPYILETISGLPSLPPAVSNDHSIVVESTDTAVIHIDRFRDKTPIFPQDVSANSITDRNDPEYDIAWVADTGNNSVVKYEKWNYKQKLSIDYTKIGEKLENFPLCVKLDSSRIDYGNTYDGGRDIRFTDSLGNLLKYEIEKWKDGTTDTSIIWVKVPEISSTGNTIVYMYYGNPDAQDAQDTENVWDENYVSVWHMNSTSWLDSTYNNNDGVVEADVVDTTTSGKIGSAGVFSGGYPGSYVDVPSIVEPSNKTYTMWIKADSFLEDYNTLLEFGDDSPWFGVLGMPSLEGKIQLLDSDGNSTTTTSVIESDQWYFVAYTSDSAGNTSKIYLNDIQDGPNGTANLQTITGLGIGGHGYDFSDPAFDGLIDEVRISDIARSDTWIKASYYSENDELVTFSDEESIRYAGLLKVGGFNSPQSISVNSSNGEVWVADTGDAEVVKLSREGHKAIDAVVNKYHARGATEITLTDVSELDTGVKISFNNDLTTNVYKITDIISDTQIQITPTLDEALGVLPQIQWDVAGQLIEPNLNHAYGPHTGISGDTVVAVWYQNDGVRNNIYSNFSSDGGANWEAVPNLVEQSDLPPYTIFPPRVAIDGDTVVAVWGQSDGVANSVYSNYSSDGGASWGLPNGQLLEQSNLAPYMFSPVRVAISGNNAVAVWGQDSDLTAVTEYSIYSNYSSNGGVSWGGSQLLDSDTGLARNPQIAISGDKAVVVWYQDSDPGAATVFSIYSNYSINGGASWGTAQLLETAAGAALSPQISISGNNAVAVWYQNDGVTNSIYSNYSTNGGATWGTAQLLETAAGAALSPQIAMSGNTVMAVWVQADGIANSIYSNFSQDGGVNWSGARIIENLPGIASTPQVSISGDSAVAVWYQNDGSFNSIYANHTGLFSPSFSIPVGRELARISGFTSPVSISVDSESGNCWVADEGDTVVWINGDIGEADIETEGYNINTDSSYHKIITGLANPVSVASDPLSGDCWVACDGDTYIVKLLSGVPNGYDIDNPSSSDHIRIYGFNLPQAVSVDPTTGECWVADGSNGGQVVKLGPNGHEQSDYTVAANYSRGDTEIGLTPEGIGSDTSIVIPLKVSFDENHNLNEIKYVYEIEGIEGDTLILETGLVTGVSSGVPLYQELVRVGGFASPSDVSAFVGPDLGEGLHPWGLQVRELYVVNTEKIPADETDGWKAFPAMVPVHDATPQFRWRYPDVDGSGSPLQSYRIRIYTINTVGSNHFVKVWDFERTIQSGIDIMPGTWIRTDWDKVTGTTTKENDSTSIYSADYSSSNPDLDDCPDLSQQIDDTVDSDTGDRTYYVQLTVTNKLNNPDTYPAEGFGVNSSDAPIVTFVLDKTPPGSYRVCGTQKLVPVPDNVDNDKFNIKKNHGDSINQYLQTDNYYWDEVWVEWDGGNTEIVQEDSPWIDTKEVTVRVKVKDKNNENYDEVKGQNHPGHGDNEFDERDTDCSGISLDAQYRYRSTSMAPDEWSIWKDCDEVRLFDNDAHDSEGATLNTGGEKNTFVWLYAKNVKFENGDTNLIQFRVQDEGDLEITRDLGDTIIWITPNMGYSHADTEISQIAGKNVIFQTASGTYGYPIQIDTDKPQVILVDYPSNPYPHRFASFKWIGVDTTPCRYKWKLEEWDENNTRWDPALISDPFDYSKDHDVDNWGAILGTDATSTSFTETKLQVGKWYRFWVKAKDRDGVGDGIGLDIKRQISDDVVWVWYVSPEAPDTIITYGPSGEVYTINIINEKFMWKGVGGTPPYSYEYRVNGGSWSTPLLGEVTMPGLGITFEAGKTYVFEARVGDNNGVDPTPARRIFTVVDPNKPPYSTVSPKNLYKYFREMVE